jgi:hypothetical protein
MRLGFLCLPEKRRIIVQVYKNTIEYYVVAKVDKLWFMGGEKEE